MNIFFPFIWLGALIAFLPSVSAVSDNTELLPDSGPQRPITYSYRTFHSCAELESTAEKLFSGMIDQQGGMMYWKVGGDIALDTAGPMQGVANPSFTRSALPVEESWKQDFSATNIQVQGVDEADTVKTDGKYIYSYQESEKAIALLDAKTLERKQMIRIPQTYYNIQFYVQENMLILTATRSIPYNARWYGWYNAQERAVIALYDITNRSKVSLIRVLQSEGNITDSRLDDDGIMTVIVWNSISYPPIFLAQNEVTTPNFSSRSLIPNIFDTTYTAKDGIKTANKKSVDCKSIGAVLPDNPADLWANFSPSLTTVLRFDTRNPDGALDSKMVFASNSQIHLSKHSLYLTTQIFDQWNNSCPPWAMCAMMWNPGKTSTLVHRFSFDGVRSQYVYSKMIEGSPLSQYSMDEDANKYFRVVTSREWEKRSTSVSILSPSGEVVGSLDNLAPGENFQSSRFIGNRLYLVTFEQIDPLFVIDLTNAKSPKVLGELKIPGYSTYLHPYDSDRLIGIGYDTFMNPHGGVQNGGLKIDLYNVKDIKNPKQEQSLVLGDQGSYSEVLSNPRAFVWYASKNLLLFPAMVIDKVGTGTESYTKSAHQGVFGIHITPSKIEKKFMVTHISTDSGAEARWKKACEPYLGKTWWTACVQLLDGTSYCRWSEYVPEYCFSWATVESYIADQIWNYSEDFITRALYIGEQFYTIGSSKIRLWNLSESSTPQAEAKFKTFNNPIISFPIPEWRTW